jgi:hypothetical protein
VTVRALMAVVRDVCEISCGPEHLLAQVYLTRRRVLHPAHEMGFVGPICDDGDHVPRPFQSEECASSTPFCLPSATGHN